MSEEAAGTLPRAASVPTEPGPPRPSSDRLRGAPISPFAAASPFPGSPFAASRAAALQSRRSSLASDAPSAGSRPQPAASQAVQIDLADIRDLNYGLRQLERDDSRRDTAALSTFSEILIRPATSVRPAPGVRTASDPIRSATLEMLLSEEAALGARYQRAITTGTTLPLIFSSRTQEVLNRLADYSEASDGRRSLLPLVKVAPALLGKIAIVLGADVLTLGINQRSEGMESGGAVALLVGVAASTLAVTSLMRDMRLIDPSKVLPIVIGTCVGAVLSAGGLSLGESDAGARNLGIRTLGAFLFGIGLVCVSLTLPQSFGHSEIVHGNVFSANRKEVAAVLIGLGIALATGLTLSRGAPHDRVMPKIFPFGVAHAFAALGIIAVTMALCINNTNTLRELGGKWALRRRLRQAADEARVAYLRIQGSTSSSTSDGLAATSTNAQARPQQNVTMTDT